MKFFSIISFLLFTINSFASGMLDSIYNSIELSYVSSSDDFTSSEIDATINSKPKFSKNFALSYSITETDFNEDEFGLQGYDVSSIKNNFKLCYVLDYMDSHLIPFISYGTIDRMGIPENPIDADTKSLGFLARIIVGEKGVLNISYEHIKFDYKVISSLFPMKFFSPYGVREYLDTIANNSLNDSQFNSLKAAIEDEASILGVSYEYHFNDNISYTLGLTTDFVADISTIKLAAKYKLWIVLDFK